MKIRLEITSEAEMEIVSDESGNPIAVVFTPFFTSKKGSATLASCTAKSDSDKTTDQFDLTVSGATGEVKKRNRQTTVKAAVDEMDEEDTSR